MHVKSNALKYRYFSHVQYYAETQQEVNCGEKEKAIIKGRAH